ncbi:hypothetical protein PIB30_086317 [Stylosanthes scabra]|uniref:Cytochrome P450 n=1 Tax=Stylosanthes scabra TaxID=79078 RepID=A0ABU6ZRQ9_9FABA|nr:hypothetical protein [Stylosanthes scabra]
MSLKLGKLTTIVISSPQFAKEILHKHDQIFSYRTIPDSARAHDRYLFSIFWMPPISLQWRVLRRICATKVFSAQNIDATQVIREKKIQELLDFVKIKVKKVEAFCIDEVIFTTMLNILSNTLFSMDFARYASDKSQEFKNIVGGVSQEFGRPNVVDHFTILGLLDPQGVRSRMKIYLEKLITLFDGLVEERLKSRGLAMGSESNNNDVLDSVLNFMLEENSQITRSHVIRLLLDLFVAGIDTTSNMLEHAMTELLYNPEKFTKVREEIQQVLSKSSSGKLIEESNISKLPFLRAIVKETLRLHPPAPFLMPHKSNKDVEVCGYMIPKNSKIIVNLWGMGRDSSVWENPNEFLPERFLGSKIDFKGQYFELIPFGAGRRICPGLPMASRTIHIILASLLYHYDWKLMNEVKTSEDIDYLSENFGVTLHKTQSLLVIPMPNCGT